MKNTRILEGTEPKYQLALTNLEVKLMFQRMIRDWFATVQPDYNDFVKAMFIGDVDAMNEYMNRVALQTFSYFDTGDRAWSRTGTLLPWIRIRTARGSAGQILCEIQPGERFRKI